MNIDSVACELYAKYVEKLCWPSTTITHPAVEYYSHFWINARVEIMENSFLSWQKLQENQVPKQGFFAKLFKKKEKPLSGAYVPVQYCDNAFLTPKQWEMIDKKEVAEMHVNMCVRESSHELTVLLHDQAGKENPLKIHATTDSSFGRFNHVDVK